LSVKVQIKGLKKTFVKPLGKGEVSELCAIENMSFEVVEGEIFGIIGPSGCGKTSLLRLIDGLMTCDCGEIWIDGKQVYGPGPDRAFVFQHFGLLPWRRVMDNVAFGLELKGVPKEQRLKEAQKYVDLVGLHGFERHFPHELSGGMQQRVGLARAIAVDPKVLLMDEPLGALDAQTREILEDELLKIVEAAGKTVIYVTHNIDEVIHVADRVAILTPRPGKVKEIVEVKLPEPRWEFDLKGTTEFLRLRAHLYNTLQMAHGGARRKGIAREEP
jgi:NitT/TauT family transport system ATP-binding protein